MPDYSIINQLPVYQRLAQKLRTLDPSQKAVLSSTPLMQLAGRQQMARKIWGQQASEQIKGMRHERRVSDKTYKLRKKDFEQQKDYDRWGNIIAGAGIGVSALTGYQNLKTGRRLAKLTGDYSYLR